jgi:hypothetical protein
LATLKPVIPVPGEPDDRIVTNYKLDSATT